MKKTFTLTQEGLHPDRVIGAIKHFVRKYVQRERRKRLPEEADYWAFACRVGPTPETAETKLLNAINPAIDSLARAGASAVYIEVLASASRHIRHPAAPVAPGALAAPAPVEGEVQPEPLATGRDDVASHSLQDPA